MSWTPAQQEAATAQMEQFQQQFQTALTAWQNGLLTNNPQQFEQQTEEVLRKWRAFTEELQLSSEIVMQNQGVMNVLADLVEEMSEQKRILGRLKSEAVTREDQAHTLNPKNANSPYTNILGLQRSFSSSTRTSILIATIVFGIVALILIGVISYFSLAGPIQSAYSTVTGAIGAGIKSS